MSSLQFNRWFTVSTALALVVAVGVIVKDRTEPQVVVATSTSVDADQQQRLRRLEAQLAALSAPARADGNVSRADLEARLAAMQAAMDKLQHQPGNAATGGSEVKTTRTERRPDEAEQIRAEQEQTQLRVASLENAMASEPVDLAWSSTAAAEVARSMLDPRLAKTQLGEVRCASSFCRIDVKHATPEAEQTFMMQVTQLDVFQDSQGFIQHQPRPDGSLATVMYVSRSGRPLPSPEQS